MNERLSDQYSLSQQRAVLIARRKALAVNNGADKAELNRHFFETLRAVCPLRLKRCLIERNTTRWVAAYLIQRIGQKGYRYLLPGKEWRIVRSRHSAKVLEIDSGYWKIFEDVVNEQKLYFEDLNDLIDRLQNRKRKRNDNRLQSKQGIKKRTKSKK